MYTYATLVSPIVMLDPSRRFGNRDGYESSSRKTDMPPPPLPGHRSNHPPARESEASGGNYEARIVKGYNGNHREYNRAQEVWHRKATGASGTAGAQIGARQVRLHIALHAEKPKGGTVLINVCTIPCGTCHRHAADVHPSRTLIVRFSSVQRLHARNSEHSVSKR